MLQTMLGKEKTSGQLIFENWSGGPVDVFSLEPQPKFSKSNKCQHADMNADAEVATCSCQVLDARCWQQTHRVPGES